jgi:hypothetical protein
MQPIYSCLVDNLSLEEVENLGEFVKARLENSEKAAHSEMSIQTFEYQA